MLTSADIDTVGEIPKSQGVAAASNVPIVDLSEALDPRTLIPWLEYQLADHAAEVAAFMVRNAKFLTVTDQGIADDFIAGHATDFAKEMKAAGTALDETRTRIKKPVLHAQRLIDGESKKLSDQLVAATKTVEYRLQTYLMAKEQREREAATREAARLAAEAEAAIEVAQHTDNPLAADAAVAAIQEAQQAEAQAGASTLDLTRLRSLGGGLTGLKETFTYEVTDITKVPAAFLQVNDAVVKAALKSGTRDIPGLRIFAERKLAYVR